jgi:hypothetical protein
VADTIHLRVERAVATAVDSKEAFLNNTDSIVTIQ